MSYFSDASLVFIPSAQKSGKAYSVKPTDGSGDLVFTRSNDTATRVGPDGLIEKVRTNQVLQSQTFDNASWVKYNSSVTANSTTAPDGTSTADTLVDNAANDIHVTYQSIALSAGEHTISCYAKANTLSHLSIYIFDGTNFFSSGIFNLSNGTVSGAGSIVSAGNGWYRVSYTATIGSGSGNVYIALSNGSTISYVGSGQSIYIWGYQAESGVATDYIATTSASVSVGPVANVPRLDYLNSSCPRLLLEPQRTNALTYSEDFSNAAYTKGQSSITSNAAIAPDGTMSADKLVEDTSNNPHVIYRSPSGTGDTLSFFAKAAERNWVGVLSNNGNISFFNIANGTLGTIAASSTATITPYGNGWYRCTLYNTHGSFGMSIYLATANGTDTYTGDGTSGAFIWGAQLEESASYATSYIPTLGAAVTRGADACSKTGISSLIGQTEGTVFVEVDYSTLSGLNMFVSIRPNASNKVELYRDGGAIYGEITASSSFAFTASKAVGTHKIAFAYKSGSSALYIDGALVSQNTTTFSFTSSLVDIAINARSGGAFNEAANYKQALLFKTRLTNAQLAELTTL